MVSPSFIEDPDDEKVHWTINELHAACGLLDWLTSLPTYEHVLVIPTTKIYENSAQLGPKTTNNNCTRHSLLPRLGTNVINVKPESYNYVTVTWLSWRRRSWWWLWGGTVRVPSQWRPPVAVRTPSPTRPSHQSIGTHPASRAAPKWTTMNNMYYRLTAIERYPQNCFHVPIYWELSFIWAYIHLEKIGNKVKC